jgi:hypothetical protein
VVFQIKYDAIRLEETGRKEIKELNLTLLWLDLVDPSTTNNFFKGNLREEASFSISSLSSPGGSYLLQHKQVKDYQTEDDIGTIGVYSSNDKNLKYSHG